VSARAGKPALWAGFVGPNRFPEVEELRASYHTARWLS